MYDTNAVLNLVKLTFLFVVSLIFKYGQPIQSGFMKMQHLQLARNDWKDIVIGESHYLAQH